MYYYTDILVNESVMWRTKIMYTHVNTIQAGPQHVDSTEVRSNNCLLNIYLSFSSDSKDVWPVLLFQLLELLEGQIQEV